MLAELGIGHGTDDGSVKIVDRHSSVDNHRLCRDPTTSRRQQECCRLGNFFRFHSLFAGDDLFGVKLRIDVAGNAGRGTGLEQSGGHSVEADATEAAERFGQKRQR